MASIFRCSRLDIAVSEDQRELLLGGTFLVAEYGRIHHPQAYHGYYKVTYGGVPQMVPQNGVGYKGKSVKIHLEWMIWGYIFGNLQVACL